MFEACVCACCLVVIWTIYELHKIGNVIRASFFDWFSEDWHSITSVSNFCFANILENFHCIFHHIKYSPWKMITIFTKWNKWHHFPDTQREGERKGKTSLFFEEMDELLFANSEKGKEVIGSFYHHLNISWCWLPLSIFGSSTEQRINEVVHG